MNPTSRRPQPADHQLTSIEDVRTLWVGNLQFWVDESYLNGCFAHTGGVLSVRIIHNKMTGLPEGYGFVEFVSHATAERILQTYNGTPMPGTEQMFTMKWASYGLRKRWLDADPEDSIFVGDLAPHVTDYLLQETFRLQYPTVRGAKVVTDPTTGHSKGYGFVKFSDEDERNRAMNEMNGVFCSNRPMRVSAAMPKRTPGSQLLYPAAKAVYPVSNYVVPQLQPVPLDNDVTSTTIFVGGLDPNVSEYQLKQIFGQIGDIVYVKILPRRGFGFVQFATRTSAEEAIQRIHGTMIGQRMVRLFWSRSPASNQLNNLLKGQSSVWGQQADPSLWSNYHDYGQSYDPYTCVQDPSAYAYGAYAAYEQYPLVDSIVEMPAATTASVPVPEEEVYDPLIVPDVEKLLFIT